MTNLKVQPNERKVQHWIEPPLEKEAVSYIGDSLIEEGESDTLSAIILKEDHGAVGWTTFQAQGTYCYIGISKKRVAIGDGKFAKAKVYQTEGIMPGMLTTKYMQVYETDDGRVFLNNASKTQLKPEEYEKKQVIDTDGYYFEQQLIYTGCDGKILKFTYREFADGTARPAFTIDATYDLTKENRIRFKGAVLDIIDYDNQSIKYKVVSGFKSGNGKYID